MNRLHWALLAAGVTLTAATQAATTTPKSQPAMNSAAPLQVSVIDHVGINVPDIDAATRFFAELMGARVISDITPGKIPDQWKSQFRWHGSSELQRFVMLQMDSGARLELFQYWGPRAIRPNPMATTPAPAMRPCVPPISTAAYPQTPECDHSQRAHYQPGRRSLVLFSGAVGHAD